MTEVACYMVRIGCIREIRLMTLVAVGVNKLIVTIHVTRLTLDRNVSAGQREPCCAVIERCTRPVRRRVTLGAIMTEVACYMVRIGCVCEIRLMTLIAIRVHKLVVAIHVTRLALDGNVRPRQWEPGRAMIERRRAPSRCRVALGTIMTEVSAGVVRVARLQELCLVTLIAIGRELRELVALMTCSALRSLVRPGKRKTSRGMIKARAPRERSHLVTL